MRQDRAMTDSTTELVHTVVVPRDGGAAVAVVTLDSQHNRNALSQRLREQLADALDAADADPDVRAVVIAAAGPVFCSGADMAEATAEGMERGARALVALQRQLVAMDTPVVARIHGPVRAGGLGIVSACDVAISAESVSYAFTEVRLGLAPAVISLTTLPRLTERAASETFLGGHTFDALEAQRIGPLTRTVPDRDLDAAVDAVVAGWCLASPQGLRETKALLNRSLLHRIDALGEQVAVQSARLFGSDEARGAMRAFLDRRNR